MKIESKEVMKYVMDFYQIPFVKIRESYKDLGKVTSELKYEPGTWKFRYAESAFDLAIQTLNADIDSLKDWREKSKKVFSTHLVSKGKNYEYICATKDYLWKSDIEDAKLKVSVDENGKMVLSGLIDNLKNFLSYANDHLRYCNGSSYAFPNNEVNELINLFGKYGLRNPNATNYEWWKIGIVD